ncbi:beta-catenin [Oopsacas minuta]|uniref:Beta-catenin n=1 Tax=Oopsacas minuta TaxID=111878 RepID=A0A2H4G8Y2_9METZ|nr:Beta-catenin [Oopsacas minuta]AVM85904.1 beta-catenin [Oopsacas minuta]KAI6654937.1 beta-catenin [Oopsacas minuta]
MTARQLLQRLHEEKAITLAGIDTDPYNRRDYELRLSQIEDNIRQFHFTSSRQYSPHRTNNSPSEVMDKFQSEPVTHDSGIVTRSASPRFDDDEDNVDGPVVYAWDQAVQGVWHQPYNGSKTNLGSKRTNGQGERLKSALFTESHSDRNCASTPTDHQTNVQRLTRSSQAIKKSITNLLLYKTDTEITTQVIPELLKVLKDTNREIIEKASLVIATLAKKEASRNALLSTPLVLTALIQAIGHNVNDEAAKYSSSAISSLSVNPLGVKMIHTCDGLAFIMLLLTSDVEHVIVFAITCLHNMLGCRHNASVYMEEFRNRGGVQHLVRLLNGHRERVLAIIADCLHLLAINNEETKQIIYNYNGSVLLVKILADSNFEKLIWIVGRLIKVLTTCPNHKQAIVQAGGIPILSKHLTSNSPRIVQLYLRPLLTLSDVVRPEDNLESLIAMLLNLLRMKEDTTSMMYIVGILSNITCNNPINKTAICNHNGIHILLYIVLEFSQKRDININSPQINELLEAVICTLRHVTSKHEREDFAQNEVREQKGLDVILQLFLNTTHWTLIKACLGLLRNLSISTHNRIELRKLSVIPQLVELLRRAIEILFKTTEHGNTTTQEGVNMEDVLVLILSTVEVLAKDHVNRNLIGKHDSIPVIIRLLFSDRKRVLEHAVACLCELSGDQFNMQEMERANCSDMLVKLLQRCQDENIEAYVTMTLHKFNEFRNYDGNKIISGGLMDTIPANIPTAPRNVTPIGDLDYYNMSDDPGLAFYNPGNNYGHIQEQQMDYYGNCVPMQQNQHISHTHGFPDSRMTPSLFYPDKQSYYEMNSQPMQIPYYHPEQDLTYQYNTDFPIPQTREFYQQDIPQYF